MIPMDPVDDDVCWSRSMRTVIEDLFPTGTNDLVDEIVPSRRPVRDVEIDLEWLFSQVKRGKVKYCSKVRRKCPLLLRGSLKSASVRER
jgi:hypothetical protein